MDAALWVIAGLLTVVLVGRASYVRWAERRCQKRGHRWESTATGMRCARCKHGMDVGDRM